MSGRVPVTIIGGYLGAGKTTLLNQLLAGDHGRRLAVLVNDFGSVNIDADLITSRDGDTVSLQNGCVCCSIADALGDALDQVLALEPRPDQIVIEASGVADPAKIAHYGQGWPDCRLDAVVVLADCETIRTQARDRFVGELVTRQLRGGDLVVLTKTDLVLPATLQEVRSWVRHHTGDHATLLGAAHGRVDPLLLLDVGAGTEGPATPLEEGTRPWRQSEDVGDRFETITMELVGPVSRSALEITLDGWPETIVRVKGIVDLDDDGQVTTAIVQRVGRRWSIEGWPDGRPVPPRRLVLIALAGGLVADGFGLREGIDALVKDASP